MYNLASHERCFFLLKEGGGWYEGVLEHDPDGIYGTWRLARVFFGGWDGLLIALLVFITTDYVTGVMCAVADKTLSSQTGFIGLLRKVLILMLVGIAHILDVVVLGTVGVLRSAVIFYYMSNEGISILENVGHLGLPIPMKLRDVLEQLRTEKEEEDNGHGITGD